MGTTILGSRDCLPGRFRHETLTLAPPPFKPLPQNPNFCNSRRRKRTAPGPSPQSNSETLGHQRRNRSRPQGMVAKFSSKNLVMGQVKILKRGESLLGPQPKGGGDRVLLAGNRKPRAKKKTEEEAADLVLGSTDRLGPDPETVQKQIGMKDMNKFVDGVYSGSAFIASPPPSSLPVPGFLGKGGVGTATCDLRRLLRLD